MTTFITSGILGRLATETRTEHEAIERVLDLTGEALTLARYRERLEWLYGFYRPVEARLHPIPGLALHERRKAPLLEVDLRALEAPWPLPTCPELPPLRTAIERFGCLYVLEGATLGGRVIGRHVWRRLAITPQTGGRFFHGYGRRTAEMWQAFRAALVAFARTPAACDGVVC